MHMSSERRYRPLAGGRGRAAALAVLVGMLALLGATGARAAAPIQHSSSMQLTVENPAVCGFGISWQISASGLTQLFLGSDGKPVFALLHVREQNTLTNMTTHKTVSDDPVYEQIAHFEDGVLSSVDTMGLWVDARDGGDSLTDVGRVSFLVVGTTRIWIFAAGQHPFREVSGGDLRAGLAAFCDLLA